MFEMIGAYSLQYTQHAGSIDVSSKLGRVKADLYVTLCSEVINLSRTYHTDYLNETHRITHVAIVQMELWMSLKMSNTFTIIYRTTADDAVHFISFANQKL